jgi:tetratricopeptide (TPR) repeat protein
MDQSGSGVKRLDGWKSIGAYFKRDRSTVMRWALERNLPVHRIPGGKQGSVFALEHELAAWASQTDDADVELPTPDSANDAIPTAPKWRWPHIALATVAVAGIGFTLINISSLNVAQPIKMEIPANPTAAADYLAARDSWARRTPKDIGTAITLYQNVIAREPGFAPAYAGLAEAWLIFREYGEVGDLEAYNAAHTAALRALALDPELPSAHRAMGFIHYWRENDGPRAVAAFKRAIALNDRDAQSHFWYANVLADIGDHDAARAAYDRARLLSPGSQVIEVEAACAEWQAGRDRVALERLTTLAKSYPDDATVHNCLAWLHIGKGDIVKFAHEYAEVARSRNEPALIKRAAALNTAVVRDPKTAHRVVTADMRQEFATGERRGRETPAFYASAMGDREELLRWMHEARDIGEQWYSATITSRIAARWKNDAEIMAMLKILRAARPKTRGV